MSFCTCWPCWRRRACVTVIVDAGERALMRAARCAQEGGELAPVLETSTRWATLNPIWDEEFDVKDLHPGSGRQKMLSSSTRITPLHFSLSCA